MVSPCNEPVDKGKSTQTVSSSHLKSVDIPVRRGISLLPLETKHHSSTERPLMSDHSSPPRVFFIIFYKKGTRRFFLFGMVHILKEKKKESVH